jgi:chemotaxis protein CheC
MWPEVKVTAEEDREIDRLSELANIGAGHAATAFSQLTGHTISMHVPRVSLTGEPIGRWVPSNLVESDPEEDEWSVGVIFEFDGCISAIVAILFRRSMCIAVVRQLVGQTDGFPPPETVESILMEVGNILASHVASAIADTLDARLLPSIPVLALEDAGYVLNDMASRRDAPGALRIECELADKEGELGGLVVLIPDRAES